MTTTFAEASHPDTRKDLREREENLGAQLRETAEKIETHRLALRPQPSQNQWVREWSGLGSQKAYSKILNGDFEQISVSVKLGHYRGVLAALGAMVKSRGEEELYDDLAGAQEGVLNTLRLMHHYGKDRLILVKGGNGSGKTSMLSVIRRAVGGGAIHIAEANDFWKSEKEALQDLLIALGTGEKKLEELKTNGDRLKELLDVLHRQGRVILAIDEAHHCTGRILNLIKTLINRTEVLVIMAGMDTLLQKLRSSASEESKQLFQNRLFCALRLNPPDSAGVRLFLNRRLGVEGKWRESTCVEIAKSSINGGAWSFLRRVVDQLATSGETNPDDGELMAAAARAAIEISPHDNITNQQAR